MMRPSADPLPPAPAPLRWTAVVMVSIAMFGSSYIFDSIGPLAKVLADQLRFSDSDIGLLQAVCSFPSIFMALLGGIILDRIGVKKAGMIFALLCLAGAVITALSPRLPVMLAGRLVFGLGIGCLSVAGNTSIAKWFSAGQLSFVFGLSLTISRLGSLAAQVSPTWARWAYAGWREPLLLAIVFGVITVLAVGVYWAIESRAEGRYRFGGPEGVGERSQGGGWAFGRTYWLSVLLCVTFYSGIFPFQTFAQKFFVEAHGAAPETASLLVGMLTVIAMVATPLFGLLVDRIGHRALLMTVGSALLLPVYLLMAHTDISLFVPMILMGLAFSLVPAVLWPSVMLIVPHGRLGKAFGLMAMVQSIGLTGFNFLIGWTNDLSGAGPANAAGYAPGMWLFSATVLASVVFGLLLWRHEARLTPPA